MDWLVPVLPVFAFAALAAGIWNVIAVRTYRSRLERAYADFEPAGTAHPPYPEGVGQLIAVFEEAGFELLPSHLTRDGRLVVLLLNRADGIIAEIIDVADVDPVERYSIEVTSLLADGRGILSTSNRASPSMDSAELRQTFLGASPAELLQQHHAAIQHLDAQGLGIRLISTEETILSRQEWSELQLEQVRNAPNQQVVDWIRDARKGYPTSSGAITESPTMRARLEVMLGGGIE